MDMSRFQWFFAGGGLVLYAFIVTVMVRRKIRARFPIFFYFIISNIGLLCGLNIAARVLSPNMYFYVYFGLEALVLTLSFAVFREVFVNLLKPFNALIDLGKMLFSWAVVFLVFAVSLTAVATGGSHPDRLTAAIFLFQRSVWLIQCGLLLLLVLFDRRLGISWRSHGMCMALGLGIFAASNLVMCAIGGRFQGWAGVEEFAQNSLCLAVVLGWAIGLAIPAPVPEKALDSPKRLILQRWDEGLTSYGYGQPETSSTTNVESFLPGIEKTVDRVMAKKAVP